MINTREFRDLIRDIVREELGERNRYKIGEIASVGDKVSIIFSGEPEPSQKEYTYLKSYHPVVGDRVILARDKGTYFVVGAIGQEANRAVYVVEEGSNANGEYVRYSDGLQVCLHLINTPNYDISVSGGVMYRSDSIRWDFPISFNDDYPIAVSGGDSGSNTLILTQTNPLNGFVNLRVFYLGQNPPSTSAAVMRIVAIGRWK